MYNADIKKRFIKDTCKSTNGVKMRLALFEKLQETEERLGKDICAMTPEEIQTAIMPLLTNMRGRGNENIVFVIRSYINWCVANNVEGATEKELDIARKNIDRLSKVTVKNPLHLKKYLDDVFTAEKGTTFDICKCFFWMAYGGCREADVMSLTATDIDLERGIIHCPSWNGIVYKEGYDEIVSCCTATSFKYYHKNYSGDGSIYRDRVPGDSIFRGVRGKGTPPLMSFRSNVSTKVNDAVKNGKTDLMLSYYKVWLSGEFYRIREIEVAGFPIDDRIAYMVDRYFLSRDCRHKNKQFNKDELVGQERKVYLRQLHDYREDYENWKLTIL